MPYIKLWVHLIFSTKNRRNQLNQELKSKVIEHIKINAKKKNIYLDFVNGTTDHLHLLISVKADQSVSKLSQLIKGESSHWLNENFNMVPRFEWQEEYIAVSVSESVVPKIREYIKNQEEHHKKKSFTDEYREFLTKYGFIESRAKAL
jgi:REP element-mobilizing transposase RayT